MVLVEQNKKKPHQWVNSREGNILNREDVRTNLVVHVTNLAGHVENLTTA